MINDLKKSTKTATVRVNHEDWFWLMQNRGIGNIAGKIHELIEKEMKNTERIK